LFALFMVYKDPQRRLVEDARELIPESRIEVGLLIFEDEAGTCPASCLYLVLVVSQLIHRRRA
jgi:hypothetical protein